MASLTQQLALWLSQRALNWFWTFPARVMDTMDRALGADPTGNVPSPETALQRRRRRINSESFLKCQRDFENIMRDFDKRRQASWRQKEAKLADDRERMIRKNTLELARRMIRLYDPPPGHSPYYKLEQQLELARKIWNWTNAKGIPARPDRIDAISQSIIGDPKQNIDEALASADRILEFLEP